MTAHLRSPHGIPVQRSPVSAGCTKLRRPSQGFLVPHYRKSARHSSGHGFCGAGLRLAKLGFLLLFCLFTARAEAIIHGKAMANYEQRVWTTQDGLSDNSVFNVIQSRDGYLRILTRFGLTRFDGLQFTAVYKSNVPALNRNITSGFFEDREGQLWFGTAAGVAYLKDGRVTPFAPLQPATGHEPAFVFAIFQDHEGSMWFGTEAGLFRYRQGEITSFTTKDGLTSPKILAITEDMYHRLWVGTNGGGLNLFENGKFVGVHGKLSSDYVTALLADGDMLWIGTASSGLRCLRNGQFTICPGKEALAKESIRTLYKDRKGYIWVATQYEGLRLISPSGEVFAYRKGNGLASNRDWAVTEDNEGNLWIGTMNGLIRLRDRPFQTVGPRRYSEELSARTVIEDHHGDFWIGTHTEGLFRIHHGKISGMQPGLSSNAIRSLYVDKDDSLWIGTDSGGLNHLLKNGKVAVFTTRQGLADDVVKSILKDRDGNLWIGTNNGGVSRFRNGTFTNFTVRDGLGSNTVVALLQGRDGTLWFGTDGGLSKLREGKFTNLTTKDGLSEDRIRSLYEDSDGVLWIGTREAGLNSIREGKITRYTDDRSLASDGVHSILEDDRSNLWMGSIRGLVRMSKKELNDFAAGRIHAISSANYGVADGMISEQCSSAVQPAGWKGHDGRLWFPTTDGVVVVTPSEVRPDPPPPAVTIEEILVDRTLVPAFPSAQEFRPGRGDFEFHFTALAFGSPETVVFKYELEGYDKNWTEAGGRRVASYTNIPPGTYRFRVVAKRGRGSWNERAAEVEFHLRPHFYQIPLFWAGNVLVGLTLVFALYRLRLKHLQDRERDLAALVEARTKDLAKERAFLQQVLDINPSFIFAKDREGRFTLVNRALAEHFHAEPETLLGKTTADVHPHRSEVEAFRRDDLEVMDTLREKVIPEEQITDDAGNVRWLQAVKCPIVGEDGTAQQVLGVATDITERKKAEEELRQYKGHLEDEVVKRTTELTQANAQLREEIAERKRLEEQLRQAQKMEAIGTLSGGIAHDFNNLLTVIKGYGRLVLDGVQNDAGLRPYAEQIDQAAERAASLTSQLLAFSRRQVLQPKIINLSLLVMNLDKMLRRLIGEDIEMVTVTAPDLGSVKADPGQIEQVVMNLVVNARDAMPRGGKLTVETANVELDAAYAREHVSVRPGRYVLLAISDTGSGMDPETQARVFEPFFTTKEKGQGTGLGLSMVYGIVKQSGGHIWVYSEPGHGTTFKIYLPSVDEPAQILPREEQLPAAYQGTGTILLVEDDHQVRELAYSVLTACGYSVLVAESSQIALSICEEHSGHIDLLLTDVVMPGLSGCELAKRVMTRTPSIKVLYMSAYTANAIVHHGVLDPNTSFLQKPFTPSSLTSKVDEVLHSPKVQHSPVV